MLIFETQSRPGYLFESTKDLYVVSSIKGLGLAIHRTLIFTDNQFYGTLVLKYLLLTGFELSSQQVSLFQASCFIYCRALKIVINQSQFKTRSSSDVIICVSKILNCNIVTLINSRNNKVLVFMIWSTVEDKTIDIFLQLCIRGKR